MSLLPCPFCGSEDVRRMNLDFTDLVECHGCKAVVTCKNWNERAERRLTAPARVGATVFRPGVLERLVIARAQREHEHLGEDATLPLTIAPYIRKG